MRQNPAKTGLSDRVAYLFSDCLLLLKRPSQQRWGAVGSNAVAAAVALISSTTSAVGAAASSSSAGGDGGGAGGAAGASAPSALVLKKGVPLAHFHLIDLGMQVNPDNGGKGVL